MPVKMKYIGINAYTFNDFKYVFAESRNQSVMRIDSKGKIDVVTDTPRGIRIQEGKIHMDHDLKLIVGSHFEFETKEGQTAPFTAQAIMPVDRLFKDPEEGTTRGGANVDMVERFYDLYYKASKMSSKQRRPDLPFIDV